MEKDNIHIRKLLERWYEGSATPSDQRELISFFNGADDLPDDLSSDRELFIAMSAPDKSEPMPEEYSRRIDLALDVEIKRKRLRFPIRRIYYIAGCAAASLLLVFGAVRILSPQRENTANMVATATDQSVSIQADTLLTEITSGNNGLLTAAIRTEKDTEAVGPKRKIDSDKSKVSKAYAAEPGGILTADTDSLSDKKNEGTALIEEEYVEDWLTDQEKERLLAANYRIIDNMEEAEAITASVSHFMQTRIAETTGNVETMNATLSSQYIRTVY